MGEATAGRVPATAETEAAMQAGGAKSIPAGAAPKPEVPETSNAADAPTIKSVQPQLQQTLRANVNAVAKGEGLQDVPATTSVRDLGKNLGDQFWARSKDTFAKIQETTGVDLNDLHDKISTLDDKITDAIDNPEKQGQLEQQKLALENRAEGAFKSAKDAGIDPEQARTDWKKFNASYDYGKQIRASTDGRIGIDDGELTDPNKLAPRLQKMADSNSPTQPGRLQQFMGEDNTNDLLNGVEQHRGAIKDFEPTVTPKMPATQATGQKALADFLAKDTGKSWTSQAKQLAGLNPKTNYIGSYARMMTKPEEFTAALGPDAEAARAYITSQAKWQAGKMLAKGATAYGIAKILGISVPQVLHTLIGSIAE
jgi:hypothetical protein